MTNEYPTDWDTRRKQVYKRDSYKCQNCGRAGGVHGNAELHAHHIVPKSNGGTHKKSNLKTVCRECHNAIHGNSIAPSGKEQHKQTQHAGLYIKKLPLDLSQHTLHVQNEVNTLNRINNINECIEQLEPKFGRVFKFVDKRISIRAEEIPSQIASEYEGTSEEIEEQILTIAFHLDKLANQDFSAFDPETKSLLESYISKMEQFLLELEEFLAYIEDTEKLDSINKEQYSKFKLYDDRLGKKLKQANEDLEKLMNKLSEEIDKGQRIIRKNSGSRIRDGLTISFDKCPNCGEYNDIIKIPDLYLIRCDSCNTEFQDKGMSGWQIQYHEDEKLIGMVFEYSVLNNIRPFENMGIQELEGCEEASIKYLRQKKSGFILLSSLLVLLGSAAVLTTNYIFWLLSAGVILIVAFLLEKALDWKLSKAIQG